MGLCEKRTEGPRQTHTHKAREEGEETESETGRERGREERAKQRCVGGGQQLGRGRQRGMEGKRPERWADRGRETASCTKLGQGREGRHTPESPGPEWAASMPCSRPHVSWSPTCPSVTLGGPLSLYLMGSLGVAALPLPRVHWSAQRECLFTSLTLSLLIYTVGARPTLKAALRTEHGYNRTTWGPPPHPALCPPGSGREL